MLLASLPPADQFWLARKRGKGPLLLHVPGASPRETPDRIRLYDCENGGSGLYPRASIRPVHDPARLEEEKRGHGSFTLSPAAKAVLAQDDARGRQAAPRPRCAPPKSAPRALSAEAERQVSERAEKQARERVEKLARDAKKQAEQEAREAAVAREREAALERYAGAGDSADARCWAGRVRRHDGLVRPAVLDPGAQPPGAVKQYLLLPPDASGAADVWIVAGTGDLRRAPELLDDGGTKARVTLARYRDWQRDEVLHRAEAAALAAIPGLAEDFGSRPPETAVPWYALEPEMDDVRLALLWSDERHYRILAARHAAGHASVDAFSRTWARSRGEEETPSEASAREEMERLLSARIAEKAARWVYECSFRGLERAEDVAGQQVKAEFDGWLRGLRHRSTTEQPYYQYDLELATGGGGVRRLDVKNCRAAWIDRDDYRRWIDSAPDDRPAWWGRTYREHCVPRFKEDRWGTPIRITGVYSPWAGLSQLLRAVPSSTGQQVVVLGETDHETLGRLEGENRAGSGLEICFSDSKWNPLDEARLLPPWTFSLPAELYPPSSVEPPVIREHFAVAARRWNRLEDAYWPLFLRVAEPHTAPGWTRALGSPWKELADALLARPLERRSSLPDLYLTVLKHFLATIRADARTPFDPNTYRTYLFGNARRDMPLGIHDPLRTVDDLVSTLEQLMQGNVRRIAAFTQFRFGSAGVLQGSHDGKQWMTLVFPYCGGKACSYQRLVLGKDGVYHCDVCGHLACARPECSYCGKDCPEREVRLIKQKKAGAPAAG